MSAKNIAVIGQGFVGGSLTTVFSERGFDVFAYDKTGKVASGGIRKTNSDSLFVSSLTEFVLACEQSQNFSKVYFVCLPTPMYPDGSADLSIVDGVLQQLSNVPGNRIAVVKSTVPPGSTKTWNEKYNSSGLTIVFNPEFLTEANALNDMRNQNRIVLGGDGDALVKVTNIFQDAFQDVKIVKTTSTNAELVKYVTNCFLAMKISFANELYQICDSLRQHGFDVNYDNVVETATLDKRLGSSHWKVPSFEKDENGNPLFGFSLSCFPKDVNALIHKALELNVKPTMLRATWEKNTEVRPQRDWEKMLGRAVSKTDD